MISFQSYFSVPKPSDVSINNITADSARISYKLPASPIEIKSVEVELKEADTGKIRSVVSPAAVNGSVLIDGLTSGSNYSVRLRSIGADDRLSGYTNSSSFTTGKNYFLLKVKLCFEETFCRSLISHMFFS